MKTKGLIIATIFFFLVVNTSYYWEGKLGLFIFPVFLLLGAAYIGLTIALLRQVYSTFKERFKQKNRFIVIGLLAAVLLTPFYKPAGLIDFDKLEGDDVLVAEREGSANCWTILKLKDDFTFRERISCFGITEIKGTFRVSHDTIYFENIEPGRHDEFYEFAIIKKTTSNNEKIIGDLVRYQNSSDTVGHELWVTKNELKNLKDKRRTAGNSVAENGAGH